LKPAGAHQGVELVFARKKQRAFAIRLTGSGERGGEKRGLALRGRRGDASGVAERRLRVGTLEMPSALLKAQQRGAEKLEICRDKEE
jgi:hypothetical protein